MKILVFLFFLVSFLQVNLLAEEKEQIWSYSHGNYQSHKFSPLKKIDISNVNSLKKSWTYRNGFVPTTKNNSQVIPIFTGSSIITSSVDGYLISLDPGSGFEKWRLKLPKPVAKRGMTFLEKEKIILATTGKGVFAINEINGKINKDFGNKGIFGNSLSLVSPIYNSRTVYVAFRSKIESFFLTNGKKKWSFDLNGARVWSGFSFDKKTKTIGIVTSNLINLWGKTNINPDYSNSLILLDSETGKIKCKFKDVKHDHWDLDMVSSPIFTDINISNQIKRVVYAFSKTGNVFLIDIDSCNFVFKNAENFKIIKTKTGASSQTYSDRQTKILKPEPLLDQKYNLNEYLKTLKNKKDIDYIKFKTKKAKFGEDFIPLSIDHDVILYGLHGGPVWTGGTLDLVNKQIIIPSNHYPWILRSFYEDRLLAKILQKNSEIKDIFGKSDYSSPFQKKTQEDGEKKIKKIYADISGLLDKEGYLIYKNKCSSCHGVVREGVYQGETEGDLYIPNLIGVSTTNKFNSLDNLNKFKKAHKYTDKKISINDKDLKKVKRYFIKQDNYLKKFKLLFAYGRWGLLLDRNKLPASIPPWGKINAIDIDTGKINWSKPFGFRKTKNGKIIEGDFNFGGVLSTAGNLLFATGTPDNYIRAYNSKTGETIWEHELPAAGSSSPITYLYKGKQYILVNAGGGKFFGYNKKLSDRIIAFKLN